MSLDSIAAVKRRRGTFVAATCALLGLIFFFAAPGLSAADGPRFEITFPAAAHAQLITGRVFVMITRDASSEPRLQVGNWADSAPLLGVDVDQLKPGDAAVIDAQTLGYPLRSLQDLPAGDYYVQGLLQIYTEFHRADGHVIWAHMDQWEGQHFNRSPGNLISDAQKIHLDPAAGYTVRLSLAKVIPPIDVPPDTTWVKRIKIQSKLLSEFWGRPIYFGATILLPRITTRILSFLIRRFICRVTSASPLPSVSKRNPARKANFSASRARIAAPRQDMSFIRRGIRQIFRA